MLLLLLLLLILVMLPPPFSLFLLTSGKRHSLGVELGVVVRGWLYLEVAVLSIFITKHKKDKKNNP